MKSRGKEGEREKFHARAIPRFPCTEQTSHTASWTKAQKSNKTQSSQSERNVDHVGAQGHSGVLLILTNTALHWFTFQEERLLSRSAILFLSLNQRAFKKAKASYFSNLIKKHHRTPKILFSVINSALNPPTNYFQNPSFVLLRTSWDTSVTKLQIWSQIQVTDYVELPPTDTTPPWTTFNLVSLQTVKVITKLKPSFCPLDIIHPCFLRLIIDTVGPGLVLLNNCLKSGSIPDKLKMAMVTPVLKKPSLDASVLENYRPISALTFITKVMEELVLQQLQSFLADNQIFEKCESEFKSLHNTETALVRVLFNHC